MWNWLRGKKPSEDPLPNYSWLKSKPTYELPTELQSEEASKAHKERCAVIEAELLEPARRPAGDAPLFCSLTGGPGEYVTFPLPSGSERYFPVFSSAFRAADYVRTRMSASPPAQYLASSPVQLVLVLRDLEQTGVRSFAIDPCPRCSVLTTLGSGEVQNVADGVNVWAIGAAAELARGSLYIGHAREAARGGRLEVARDVALESVSHVAMEDPHPHFLLGEIAIGLRDRTLLAEAKSFLRFLGRPSWEQKLAEDERSGVSEFNTPE